MRRRRELQKIDKVKPIKELKLFVNGNSCTFIPGRDIRYSDTLAFLLREKLFLTGTKVSCNEGACGACTVLLDGKAVLSCMMLAVEADGCEVTTIEGLGRDDPIVRAIAEQHEPGYGTALQCGSCTPGFVMVAKGLLNEKPHPTMEEIKEGLSGNICRCGCYPAIARAVYRVSREEASPHSENVHPEFKPRVEREHIGRYRSRIDGFEKAAGEVQFIDDITIKARFPGLLYAKYMRSPYPHAIIRSYDISRAMKLPGVEAILTYDDPEVLAMKPFHGAWTDGGSNANYKTQFFPQYQDRKVLDDHVRWVGDEAGFIVAAETEEIAEEALRIIEVEWEPLSFALSVVDAMGPDASVIHPEINPDGNTRK